MNPPGRVFVGLPGGCRDRALVPGLEQASPLCPSQVDESAFDPESFAGALLAATAPNLDTNPGARHPPGSFQGRPRRCRHRRGQDHAIPVRFHDVCGPARGELKRDGHPIFTRRMACSASRAASRSRMAWRLSCLRLPRARAISIFARPRLK